MLSDITRSQCGIAVLVESHLNEARMVNLRSGGYSVISHSPWSNKRGISVLLKDQLDWELIPSRETACPADITMNVTRAGPQAYYAQVLETWKGRMLLFDVQLYRKKLRILGVYAPNSNNIPGSEAFWEKMTSIISAYRPDVIAGDFNLVPGSVDRNPPRSDYGPLVRKMLATLEGRGYIDGWRESHPNAREYTWTRPDGSTSSRIDRIYIRRPIFQICGEWKIQSFQAGTDHNPAIVDITIGGRSIKQGKGCWHVNNNLLRTRAFKALLMGYVQKHLPKALKGWKFSKSRDILILKKPEKARKAQRRILKFFTGLRLRLIKAQEAEGKGRNAEKRKLLRRRKRLLILPRSARIAKKIGQCSAELEAAIDREAYTRFLSNRANWLTRGYGLDANFWRQDVPSRSKGIAAIRRSDGRVRKSARGILHVFEKKYSELYAPKSGLSIQNQDLLLKYMPHRPELWQETTNPVTRKEVSKVLSGWKLGKSPGPDGLSYNLFKLMAQFKARKRRVIDLLTAYVSLHVEYNTYQVTLPRQVTKGIIKVMYKKGDPLDWGNYRPLSMTNSLYKLVTAVINARIEPGVSEVVGKHQTGFIRGRQITDNIKLIQCLIDCAKQRGCPLFLAFLDQQKAYDRIDHQWLWKTLQAVGMPEPLVQAISGCYNNAFSVVQVNRRQSNPFPIARGVRQGDPLSCLLFDLGIEPFLRRIVQSPRIEGFTDKMGLQHKTAAYADDVSWVTTRLDELRTFRRDYELYRTATGAELNEKKSVILALVPDEALETPETKVGIPVIRNSYVQYLGVPVGINFTISDVLAKQKGKLRKNLEYWRSKHIFKRARARVAMVKCVSLFLYIFTMLDVPAQELDDLQTLINKYIFGIQEGLPCRGPIPKRYINLPLRQGGLGGMDVKALVQAMKIGWIQRLEENFRLSEVERAPWYNLALELIHSKAPRSYVANGLLIRPWEQTWLVRGNALMPPAIESFWKQWRRCSKQCRVVPLTRADVAGIVFWCHPELPTDNSGGTGEVGFKWGAKSYKELRNAGIIYVGQLYQILEGRISVSALAERAAERILKQLPDTWKQVWNREDGPYRGSVRTWSSLGLPKRSATEKVVPIISSNKRKYEAIASQDLMTPDGSAPDLLKNFRERCALQGVMVSDLNPTQIWSATLCLDIDYAGTADLLWRILHGGTVSGASFTRNRGMCPRCVNQVQTNAHLFWECPTATVVWLRINTLLATLEGTGQVHELAPSSFEGLVVLILRTAAPKGEIGEIKNQRRRRVWGTTLWAIWKIRCEWSFGEIDEWSQRMLIRRSLEDIRVRYQTDRHLAMRGEKAGSHELEQIWCAKGLPKVHPLLPR